MIRRLPGKRWASSEVRKIALALIEFLPSTSGSTHAAPGIVPQVRAAIAPSTRLWLVCFLLAAAAIVSMAANGDLPFGAHGSSAPASQTETPIHSN
jgi:hypothetical protein